MRSVVVAKFVPWPPNSGDKRRTLGLVRALREQREVTLCAFAGPDEDAQPLVDEGIDVRSVPLRRRPVDLATGLARGRSITAARFWDPALAEVVAEATGDDTDVLMIEHVQLLPYARGLEAGRRVLDMHNIESSLAARIAETGSGLRSRAWAVEARALRALERGARDMDVVAVVSEVDRAALAGHLDHPAVVVVPNAWDEPRPLPPAEGPVASFVALLSWGPNVDAATWFCRTVWPLVLQQLPEARLQLVGRNPAEGVRALAGPTVEVTGTVPDLDPWYARTRVCLAPLLAGGGSRLKILEALAAGRPVVATRVGAEGLEDLIGRGVLVADSPGEMASVLTGLLTDAEESAALGRRGAAAVAADHSWDAAAKPLLAELTRTRTSETPTRTPALSVLTVENSLRENGGLRVSLEHARRFRLAGAHVRIAVLQDATDTALARPDPGLIVEQLTAPGSRMRTSMLPALGRLVSRARQADVVVAGSDIGNCVVLGFVAARVARRPFAVLVQADLENAIADWVPRPLRGLTRWVHRRADAAICVADSVADGVVANGLPASRAHVVSNGIDVAVIRRRAGLPEDPLAQPAPRVPAGDLPTVIANGRLTPAKDFPLLIAAHERVLRSGCPHRLVIMGEGTEREALERLVADLGVGDSVTLTGFETEPYGPIAAADLFVLSSRTEGLPLTVLEALAVGTPVIATRCGTGTELVLDGGRYGQLVPAGEVEVLAAAIEAHLRDPLPLRERAAGGPARAKEFDAGRAADTVLGVLGELAAERSVRRRARG